MTTRFSRLDLVHAVFGKAKRQQPIDLGHAELPALILRRHLLNWAVGHVWRRQTLPALDLDDAGFQIRDQPPALIPIRQGSEIGRKLG